MGPVNCVSFWHLTLLHIFRTDQFYKVPVLCWDILTIWPLTLKPTTFIVKMLSKPLLRNYKWQQLYILWAHQSNMGLVHCKVILTIDLDIMTFPLKCLSGPLLSLETNKWQHLHIFRTHHKGPLHCHIILIFNLELWPSPWKCCLGNYSETIHGNCFIFSGQINITQYLCAI